MSGLGGFNWLNRYVGIPYKPGGRTREGVDCYGLLVLLFANEYGINLPDWNRDWQNLRTRGDHIDAVMHTGQWSPLEEPRDGCIAVVAGRRAPYHLGLYFGGGVIHAREETGVLFQMLDEFEQTAGNVTFGWWRP